jgi:hypothetical protein
MELREQKPKALLSTVAKRSKEKQVRMREQHTEWELLDTAAWGTNVSALQEASMMREARETKVSCQQETSIIR